MEDLLHHSRQLHWLNHILGLCFRKFVVHFLSYAQEGLDVDESLPAVLEQSVGHFQLVLVLLHSDFVLVLQVFYDLLVGEALAALEPLYLAMRDD